MSAIIFSKNRAMQLDLCLSSLYLNIEEKDLPISVIYNTSERHENSYNTLKEEYKDVNFVRESVFKEDVLNLIRDKTYILFLVDDNIFVNNFSFKEITNCLEENNDAIGFSLRLGRNTKLCFPVYKNQAIPDYEAVRHNIIKFKWTTADLDFNYPLEISSSVYDVSGNLKQIFEKLNYINPNYLEFEMACNAGFFRNIHPFLLSYLDSVSFCNPVNKVQTFNNNRVGDNLKYSTENLLTEFEKCGRINPLQLKGFVSNGAHQLVEMEIEYKT